MTNIIDLDKSVSDDTITLTWEILESQLTISKQLQVQVRAFNTLGVEKWHSNLSYVEVKPSINAEKQIPSPLPTEFEQMEARVTISKTETVARADEVAVNTQTVSDNTTTAIAKASEASVSADNAYASEVNAKTSETNAGVSEVNAKESETTTTQAMQDYLAMLGVDVATLIDGKLNPAQIPALSINDTFPVANTDEMLLLTAQRGDVALIVVDDVVMDSYLLSADEPTILANWKKLGVSYVANAGHATTADNATNATMINNHRVVVMTQEQYDSAVKDPDTIYLVGVRV